MSMLESALEYVAQGYKVFPCSLDKKPLTEHGFKDATQLQVVAREYWAKWPDASIGMPTEDHVVVDFDKKNGGKESYHEMIEKYGPFPQTRTHRTGGGGLHFIYLNPCGIRNTTSFGGYAGVDLRGVGGYIIMPPSPHPSGRKYEILDASPIAPCPEYIVTMVKIYIPTQADGDPNEVITDGNRNASLASLAGTMRRRGFPEPSIEAALISLNAIKCRPPLPEDAVRVIAHSISRYQPGRINTQKPSAYQGPISIGDVLWL